MDDAVAQGEREQGVELLVPRRRSPGRSVGRSTGSRPARRGRRRACRESPGRPRRARMPCVISISSDVATARSVTPAQAASASSSMSPEQSVEPSPPLAGCRPAAAIALPGPTEHVMPSAERRRRAQRHERRIRVLAVAVLQRLLQAAKLAHDPRRAIVGLAGPSSSRMTPTSSLRTSSRSSIGHTLLRHQPRRVSRVSPVDTTRQ